ncbi:MAG TPA: efflux RND transporter permease subunit [Usitatibacter sp.]|nr:efflux RND transporter permease subunit [Usitatibacter sp.]
MSFSTRFIERPVATTLLTAAIAIAGVIGFWLLPVAPLPQVDFPTIKVQAALPGASPETMAATVATPLERAMGRIAGLTEMTSASALGVTRITLQFDLDRDIDGAARDVQAAINAARTLLPPMPANPTYRKANPADAPVMILTLTSDTYTQGQMYDAASTILAQKFSQVEGVGEVTVGGSALPAVRVEMNPAALDKYGIGFEAVRAAIAGANANRPKGTVEDGGRRWQILANDQAKSAYEYLPVIVAWHHGAPVRLSDVAQVVDSVQDLRNAGSAEGKPSVLIVITAQPGANIVATVDRVKALLPQMRASIPSGIDLAVAQDRTPIVRASLLEVERSLVLAAVLVVLVVFLFLRSVRATLVAAVAVPVSIAGTFGVMYLAGYSLNNLSLMALAIATGFVVDDAIVVLENVTRYRERGESAMRAALLGAREVGFTVLSMSVSLVAVFIPILFMGGIVGRLFREFAVTLSAAILISLLLSVTTTPMMCAWLLREPAAPRPAGRLASAADRLFGALLRGYGRSLAWALGHPLTMLLVLAATIGLNVYLYAIVPKGFFPQQDTGRLYGRVIADQGISFQAMRTKLAAFVETIRHDPAVESVIAYTGGDRSNRGSIYIALKPLAERDIAAEDVVRRLRKQLAHEPGATLSMKASQDIKVGARDAGAQYQFTLQAEDLEDLRTWGPRVQHALARLPQLEDVTSDQEDKGQQVLLVIDRDRAAALGITARAIDATLADAFGQRPVATIYEPLNQYRVVMEVAPELAEGPEALDHVHVVTAAGAQVPLSAFSRYETTNARLGVSHQGPFAATTIAFNLAPGVALSEAAQAVRETMERIGAPASIHGSLQGTARTFETSLRTQPWLILAAIVAVYIVLGILYESTLHPLTILSTLPSAGVGAMLALLVSGMQFTVVALIGVILLIGIVKKNAIMMVDFALEAQRSRGAGPAAAIHEACLLRLRPILMTTLAALLAAIPLAVGMGEGAELRRPLGIAIVGGLVASQLLTLYTTPVVFLALERLRARMARRGSLADPPAMDYGSVRSR